MIEGSCHCGAVRWTFDGVPEYANACNCTLCRRYGVLWGYGFEGEKVTVAGTTKVYIQGERTLGFHFCPECGCIAYWRALAAGADGRRRMGVNLRLAEPDAVGPIPLRHLDGLESWQRLPRAGACVADFWF
jgi:hypothetical protein